MQNLFKILFVFLVLNGCGGGLKLPKPGDARTMEMEGQERARKMLRKEEV